MNDKLFTPSEAADILKLKKNTVYEMIKRGTLKAVKMGKQIRITESDLNELINPPKSYSRQKENETAENIIVCGQDIVLDMLCSATNLEIGTSCFVRSYEGSYNGLLALYKDEVTVASAHLWDRCTDTYNLPFIQALIPGEKIQVYHVLSRPVGLYVAKGNPKNIHSVEDFLRSDIKIVNREKGSGIRILTDSLMLELGVNTSFINGYDRIVNSHLAAAAMVSRGGSDCALGNKNVALQYANLDFIELKMEQYDLVLKESSLGRNEILTMIRILQSSQFQEEIEAMGFYDISDIGKRLL